MTPLGLDALLAARCRPLAAGAMTDGEVCAQLAVRNDFICAAKADAVYAQRAPSPAA